MPRWLKLAVAMALMGLLASMMDWRELAAHTRTLDWWLAAVAIGVIILEMPFNALKWDASLRLHGLEFPRAYLFRVSCMGYFFNNFMPSAIGGDVYRVYRTWAGEKDRGLAISAVLVERLIGVAFLMINGCIGALFLWEQALARSFFRVCALAAVLGLAALPFVLRLRRTGALSNRFPRLAILDTALRHIVSLRSEWLWLLLTSFVFQVLAAVAVLLCFAAVGTPIDVPTALLVTAAAGLASVLPISISGLGVVEGSIATMAVALGGNYEAAILAALLLRVLALAVSGLCGLMCFFDDGVRVEPLVAAEIRSPTTAVAMEDRTVA